MHLKKVATSFALGCDSSLDNPLFTQLDQVLKVQVLPSFQGHSSENSFFTQSGVKSPRSCPQSGAVLCFSSRILVNVKVQREPFRWSGTFKCEGKRTQNWKKSKPCFVRRVENINTKTSNWWLCSHTHTRTHARTHARTKNTPKQQQQQTNKQRNKQNKKQHKKTTLTQC